MSAEHADRATLEAGVPEIRLSPADDGVVVLVVRRIGEGERESLKEAVLDPRCGLEGDRWLELERARGDGPPRAKTQLTLMNARAAALIARRPERRPLAGDQLYVDLDLSGENLPPGTRLTIGSAVIEVSDIPHTGCGKFIARFGIEAQKFVNSPVGRELNLRGINARIVSAGRVRPGDTIAKLQAL